MKQLGVIILMFMTITCLGQEHDSINRTKHGVKEGYWVESDSVMKTTFEGIYENGIKEGYWKEYSHDSHTVFEGEYKNGKRHGDWYLISTKDGTKLDLQKYKNGKKAGGATLSW